MPMNRTDKADRDIDPGFPEPAHPSEVLWLRLVYMFLIGFMISVAQTMLFALALIQFVILLTNNREPNERLADFGCMVGAWIAKAARYMSVATDSKPWPWKEMD